MKIASTTGDIAPYYYNTDRSIAAPIADMADAGFKHLDLSFFSVLYKDSPWSAPGDGWKKEVEAAGEAAVKYGVDFCQSHAPDGEHYLPGEARDALILATHRSIEACGMLGIPNTVMHSKSVGKRDWDEFCRQNNEFYRLFAEDAEKYNVDMLTENSADAWNPDGMTNTAEDIYAYVKQAGIPRLHICWDTGHAHIQGLNQYDAICALKDELRAVHLQDNTGRMDDHVMPMAGTINFDQILRAFRDTGYKGCFTFEGSNTLRMAWSYPYVRRELQPTDLLRDPPVSIAKKQLSVMLEIGKWMLETYQIPIE